MASKRALVWWIPAVMLLMFVAVKSFGFRRDPPTKYEKIITIITDLIEQAHVAPKKVDDAFSKEVFKKYLGQVDPDKDIFLQSDIDYLKIYETKIDDEMLGNSKVEFVPALNKIYVKRLEEAALVYKDLLSRPFDFNKDEIASLDGEKLSFANNATERKEVWRKRLKYLVLERYADAIEQRDSSKVKPKADSTGVIVAIVKNADSTIERESRDKVMKIMNRSFNRYRTKFTEEEKFNLYVNAITSTFDPHTDFFPPVEQRGFDEELSNRFFGIGALLQETPDGTIKIVSLVTGTPAWKSGEIQPNDIILKVAQGDAEPVDIAGYGSADAVKLIRGKKGTEVRLTMKKADGSLKVVTLIRDEIKQEDRYARSAIIKKQNKIGYIYLPEFYGDVQNANGARCSKDVATEVQKLKDEHVDGIILDLRSNGGGYLQDCINMVGLFIPSGPVVQVKDREGEPTILKDNDPRVLYDGPFAVMVNEGSASASEIFAAAIQDYHRGIIVGAPSYGKGTVQRAVGIDKNVGLLMPSTELGQLKLSIQKFYRVNGGSTQLKGVTPDVLMPDMYEFAKYHEKDSPDALPWDEIAKAPIKPWNSGYDLKTVDATANLRIKNNPTFGLLHSSTEWLAKQNDKEYPLNMTKYQTEQKTIRTTAKQMESLLSLKQPMDVRFLTVDKSRVEGMDKYMADGFNTWLKLLAKDIYLNETVNVINDMVVQERLVKK